MKASEVTPGIFCFTVNIRDILFEGVWPIPQGTNMNSYLVKGDKTILKPISPISQPMTVSVSR